MGYIAAGNFILIPPAALIAPEAFSDPVYRIAYSAALALDDRGLKVCLESINEYVAFHDLDQEIQRAVDSTGTVPWTVWSQNLDASYVYCPTTASVEYALSILDERHRDRQENQIGKNLHEGILTGEQALFQLQKLHQSNGAMPEIVSAADLCAKRTPLPSEIVAGILHLGGKMAFGGGSKSFKTWTLLEMAICVSTGRPWLGKFPTTRGMVIFLNFELPKWAMEDRIRQICRAMEAPVPDNLMTWNLRGYATDAAIILPEIQRRIRGSQYILLVLDPLYKLLGSRDENAAKDMADLMNQVEKLAVELGPAIAFGSHYSKGNQASKNPMDRISGSGVFARDPDTIVTMTEHVETNAFTIDLTLRNFPQIESFVVRRKHPLMILDGALDPANLKKPPHKGGRPKEHEPDDLLNCLENNMTSSQWLQACKKADIPERTFYRLRSELIHNHSVFQSQIDEKWCRK